MSRAEHHVAILGVGLMGAQIACEYALGGCTVTLIVRDRLRAQGRIDDGLELARSHGLADEATIESARAAMRFQRSADTAAEALDEPPDLLVESLPEDLDVKVELLAPLAARWAQATIASNTSSISIEELGRAAGVSSRIVGTHYWNPPLLMPLVETVAGTATAPERLQATIALLRMIGKRPVVIEHEAPGLLWNRLQLALLRECLWLVEHGVATPETIDEVVRDGLARRWRLTGPFETVGLGGAATFDAIAANLFPVLSAAGGPASFAPYVQTDPARLAELRERRDAALGAELRAERG